MCIRDRLKNKHGPIVARFLERFGKIRESLDVWRNLGLSPDRTIVEEAATETVRILGSMKDTQMIFDNFRWIAQASPDVAVTLFSQPLEAPAPDSFINGFLPTIKDNPSLANFLRENYLETMVLAKGIDDERWHSTLGIHYIETLFRLRPANSDMTLIVSDSHFAQIQAYLNKFRKFLRHPLTKYRGRTLLEKISNSWLLAEEVFLYGKEGEHLSALRKLIKHREFRMAEEYAAERPGKLLTDLFKIYMDVYREARRKLSERPKDEKLAQAMLIFSNQIEELLRKYATHPSLDSLVVLELIPDDWILEKDGFLMKYMLAASDNSMSLKRNAQISSTLSQMDIMEVDARLAKSKQATVRVTFDKVCDFCMKKIGEKAFLIYPNGITIHQACSISQNFSLLIDPITKQHFEKTFAE
eukprot:TRINITY_DN7791_c0_g2_i1.p1 TRINITY_DN7791_c0_g2~~TRINITY_DN7791_c0_g2_i1.p1  ORF type:complete len:414 (-),score=114.11 TRINITY_DN7791_c0_g2_i1:134-1375(-)